MKNSFGVLLGKSVPMRRLYRGIEKTARFDLPVLITGETGTGKDLVAHEIHRHSSRRSQRFLPVNMGTISPELIANTLFGHEKGAFTGAATTKKGLFETVSGGTLFLDEIGTMDLGSQVSLLRVLENGKIRRVGGTVSIPTDVRILAATNNDLKAMIEKGEFREDLFYRLNVLKLTVPPLRDRGDDMILLATHFAKKNAEKINKPFKNFTRAAEKAIKSYFWPGNVRELENIIVRALVSAESGLIETKDLMVPDEDEDGREDQKGRLRVGMTLDEAEARLIKMTLWELKGNKELTAKTLGISRKSIYNKIKKYGIETPP